ncbi:CDP-glucose 4,6-dehydratase [Sphingobium sp. BYY-5]|uniref:CDP-glucose 4,6-dehydratase n=1 Tax=Sphingobium sp. BYY-5 TaxID=2926400 RepID=UPI001FA707B3|nr:CDP-glucose 4,6-dehydratase [Sphingobium sp. BYY-5]MCI4590444.1 CDP-glucose 4,6-dehydratase [Sphingobium sp. BYY-5]
MVSETFWRERRVFLTGHTGFKGSWLAMWLTQMGAEVTGFSLPADDVSLFRQARLQDRLIHVEGDIRDMAAVEDALARARPEILFHLAAQPLVRRSYDHPIETFATNVQGTAHVLDACRRAVDLKAIVCVTSDKCYENREWIWPYRESDPMGGYDPYSASKGAAELVIAAYRRSFFGQRPLLASVRAGNVIGGGDWAADRLIPDIIRALIKDKAPFIRSPASIRPWQHVLEALGGYLMIAQRLASGDTWAATGWNFGPADDDTQPVNWIADHMCAAWGGPAWYSEEQIQPHEAKILKLDCSKARVELGWRPALRLRDALDYIVAWHHAVAEGSDAAQISFAQLDAYRKQLGRALSGENYVNDC